MSNDVQEVGSEDEESDKSGLESDEDNVLDELDMETETETETTDTETDEDVTVPPQR